MLTALHIKNLVAEIQKEMTGAMKIVSTEFYKKERTACFFLKVKGKSLLALVYSYHPSGYGFYLAPASKVKMNTREKPWPIFGLDGALVTAVEQVGLDRIVKLNIEQDGKKASVVFEALGVNGNIWHVDADGGLTATLRNRKFSPGDRYEPPPPPAGLDPFGIDAGVFAAAVKESTKQTALAFFIEKNVLGFSRTMALEAVRRAGLDFVETSEVDDRSAMENLCAQITQIARWFEGGPAGYLYTVRRSLEAYPFKLKITDNEPEKFKTLSLAVMALTERRQAGVEEADEEKKILALVERAVKKIKKRIPKLEQDIEEASGYDLYKKQGELLKINIGRLKKGMTEIEVDDVYVEPHAKMIIPLDKALAPPENIEQYFKKYRKGREGLELLQRRLEITRGEYEELLKMLTDLENSFESAYERYKNEIASLAPRAAQKDEAGPRLPYKEFQLSTGLTIFVGRDGADNDRTTFEYAKPYELWFHAQQCPGSHVVMKFPNKAFEPSKREIEETAAAAAFHSKAKNDALVPVIYAERKYVRKPRKAKPGLVTVEREKSVMVAPKKPA